MCTRVLCTCTYRICTKICMIVFYVYLCRKCTTYYVCAHIEHAQRSVRGVFHMYLYIIKYDIYKCLCTCIICILGIYIYVFVHVLYARQCVLAHTEYVHTSPCRCRICTRVLCTCTYRIYTKICMIAFYMCLCRICTTYYIFVHIEYEKEYYVLVRI